MDVPFLTLPRYHGQMIPVLAGSGDSGEISRGLTWRADDQVPDWLRDAVAPVFEARNDQLEEVSRLLYADVSGLGNQMFRLDGNKEQFFLKILGSAEGNLREMDVWEILGFCEEKPPYIRGLPPGNKVWIDHNMRSILMPYFPGVLRAIGGGGYEFPLVLCLILYLEETLRALHRAGLVYMDLCPANILFQTARSGAMLFYLADMGGVKPLVSHPDTPRFHRFVERVTERRWTRREALPPGDMFPHHEADERLEAHAEYDLYCLARVAQLLLGIAETDQTSGQVFEGFSESFSLENLLKPRREEVSSLQSALQAWSLGQPQDFDARDRVRDVVWKLFEGYFMDRAEFAADYLDDPAQRQQWRSALEQRLNRYRMADNRRVEALETRCAQSWERPSAGGFSEEVIHLDRITETLRLGHIDSALDALKALAASRLVRQSRTVNYAFFHHKKLIRALHGGTAAVREQLTDLGTGLEPAVPMNEEPERATLKAVRRGGHAAELGILHRQLHLETV